MSIKSQIPTIFLTLISLVIIYLALQLKLSPPMIVGDSMQPRSFPIFLMVLNLILTAILAVQIYRNPPKEPAPILRITWLTMVLMVLFYALTVSIDMFFGISVVMFNVFGVGAAQYTGCAGKCYFNPAICIFTFRYGLAYTLSARAYHQLVLWIKGARDD